MNGLEISKFIKDLPKVELHIHIEGTLLPHVRWALAQRNNVPQRYASYEELLDSYKVMYNHRPELTGNTGAMSFLEAYFEGCEVLHKEEDFYQMAMSYFERCRDMNVRYVEPFFDTQAHTRRGVQVATILDGYLRAQKDAVSKYGVHSRWIFCFIRDESLESGLQAYEEARPWIAKGLFHAVGLAANAYERPPMLFEEAFRTAKADGLKVTMHCDFGQKDTYDHMRQAIFDVCDGKGADRIDHGLDAADQVELIAGLKDRNIPLTLCPHAYHRRTATDVLFPKIQKLLDEDVKICINSDDPVYMHDVWIDGNMQKVFTYCKLSKKEIVQLARNAVDICWADQSIKDRIYEELEGVALDD
jgi:adenosine deaminase